MSSRAATGNDSRVAARAAAISSVGAAAIHFAVMPAHWREWMPSGLFFGSLAVVQLVWALLAWTRPPAVLLAAGIVANSGAVALWVMSHTTGLPFGPGAGQPEPVHAAGIGVLLLECYVVMGAAWAWYRHRMPEPVSELGSGLVLLGANAVMACTVLVGVASGLQGHDHGHHPPVTHDQSRPVAPAVDADPSSTDSVHGSGHHDHGG